MSERTGTGAGWGAAWMLAFACAGSAVAQNAALGAGQGEPPSTAPCTVAPQPAPCGTAGQAGAKGGATARFPFPGEASGGQSPAPATQQQGAGVPAAPGAGEPVEPNKGQTDPGQTRRAFPFPGDDTAGGGGADSSSGAGAGAGGSTASGSSSSSSSSDDSIAPDAGASAAGAGKDNGAPQGRRLLKRVNPIGTKLQSPEEREAEDLSVFKFYTDTGDLQGAYLRAQDAVKTAPDDPDAHYALAQAALKLNKRDEAIAEFHVCLKLDPVDKEAKNAQKELARLK